MKRNYTLKAALMFLIATLCFVNLNAQANVRISKIDPNTNSVTLKNYGDANATISDYWFCVRPAYDQVSGMTGVTTLAPDEEVDIASSVSFPVASGEFALYNSASFGSSAAMLDFLQWGTGATNSRESVAVAAGLWVADTFITVDPPFQYGGDGTQNGVDNWSTLGIDDFEVGSNINLYPNPSNSILNVQIKNSASNVQLKVYDLLGKRVYKETMTSNEVSKIDVSNWDTGLYLIKISSDTGEETKRFIKQ